MTGMKKTIVILEDNIERQGEMKRVLQNSFSQYDCVIFDNAPDAIEWLRNNLQNTVLISLDHDLGPNRRVGGEIFDPGIGRDVARFIENQKPCCPVIVHSSNSMPAFDMTISLQTSGWQVARVVPHDDLEWISRDWVDEIKTKVISSASSAS